mgnify:CR=1 FL=1
MMVMTFLSLQNVDKTYGGATALSGASLELAAGEVHALMGENGAGKSTIIKILAGVTKPDSSQMMLNGQSIQINSTQDAFDHGFRFIHQELNIVPQLSVAENIVLGRPYPSLLGVAVNWAELNRRALAALHRLQVTHIDTRQKMARLNSGDQMLVKIASLLVSGGDTPFITNSSNPKGGVVKLISSASRIITPNQIRSYPNCSTTGVTTGRVNNMMPSGSMKVPRMI